MYKFLSTIVNKLNLQVPITTIIVKNQSLNQSQRLSIIKVKRIVYYRICFIIFKQNYHSLKAATIHSHFTNFISALSISWDFTTLFNVGCRKMEKTLYEKESKILKAFDYICHNLSMTKQELTLMINTAFWCNVPLVSHKD